MNTWPNSNRTPNRHPQFRLLAIVALVSWAVTVASAQEQRPDPLRQVGIDQRLNSPVPLDLHFRDEAGVSRRLGEYLSQRPTVLVLAYYRCPRLCTEVLNGLVAAVKDVGLELDKDYEVITVSFDPREGPALAAEKKAAYREQHGLSGFDDGWHFLTGDPHGSASRGK